VHLKAELKNTKKLSLN